MTLVIISLTRVRYHCVHDSEELEPTKYTKQACVSGQYYYINEAYYQCESSSALVPVMSRYCSYSENVVINFQLALSEEYPERLNKSLIVLKRTTIQQLLLTIVFRIILNQFQVFLPIVLIMSKKPNLLSI